jgi:uncharacterized protein YndB with AHSA1/START domain
MATSLSRRTVLAASAALLTAALLAVPASAQPGSNDPLWAGKTDTGRTITLEKTLEMPPAEVYKLWTTRDGIRTFFAPEIHLDPEVGGRYEIVFDPIKDPAGAKIGSHGARILRLVPNKEVAFDFTFPPFGPELDTKPYPTWVEVHFAPVEGAPGKTQLRLVHRGWPAGEKWDRAFEMFRDSNWPLVLSRLETYARERKSYEWPSDKAKPSGAADPGKN